jgi:N-acetylmuramoyl-L-alanine amidase
MKELKIAYCAGHGLGTAGKRVPKALDANQTREWTLNDRIARYFNLAALEYEEVLTLRTDDSTGKTDIKIKDRTKKANDWGADIYLDFHHNAGIKLGKGGGVVAISKKSDDIGRTYRDAIYAAVVAAGGLKGNRANPTYAKNFDTMKYAKMPALIIEYGFMDSRVDYPIISTDAYAKAVAYATMEAIAAVKGLQKKQDDSKVRYRVQVGCFSKEENAKRLQAQLKGLGFDAIIKEETA